MKRYKKRTIALILASVMTVVGSFAAENYKNSLMAIKVSNSVANSVNLSIETKMPIDGTLSPRKKDANTYILILPDVDNRSKIPDITSASANISSISINTMPYSNTAKGYTKITIKTTNANVMLSATNQIYVPSQEVQSIEDTQSTSAIIDENYVPSEVDKNTANDLTKKNQSNTGRRTNIQSQTAGKERRIEEKENGAKTQDENAIVEEESTQTDAPFTSTTSPEQNDTAQQDTNSHANKLIGILWAILIVFISIFFYIKAKQKIRDLAGEEINISLDDEEKQTKNQKQEQNKTGKSSTKVRSANDIYKNIEPSMNTMEYHSPVTSQPVRQEEDIPEIVDLDALFQEHQAQEQAKDETEDNEALDDFLSGFSFYEENEEGTEEQPEIAEPAFDEEAFENLINNNSITFTSKEVECITKLLGMEIEDDIRKNPEKYMVSNPINNKISKKQQIENIVSEYAISQNIIFNRDDIQTINKLMNIELEQDFLTNLRTNPKKTKQMEKEIIYSSQKPINKSEIITLRVKDMLPDLSEALKKQGGRNIECTYKPETVYYSKGYEVLTLHIKDVLPNLSLEINKPQQQHKTEDIEFADKSYLVGVGELKASSELPDLQDVLAHPEKYEPKEKEPVVVDEEALLNSIANVQFKPFYDESEDNEHDNIVETLSVEDIQEEFKQSSDLEISNDRPTEENTLSSEYDNPKGVHNNEYADADDLVELNAESETFDDKTSPQNIITTDNNRIQENAASEQKPTLSINNRSNISPKTRQASSAAQNLLSQIENAKSYKKQTTERIASNNRTSLSKEQKITTQSSNTENTKCILDGETYNIVSSANIKENIGCHVAMNNSGYTVLGFIGDKVVQLKHFDELQSAGIHIRQSETARDGAERYIIKLGTIKFVVSIKDETINYVMDL